MGRHLGDTVEVGARDCGSLALRRNSTALANINVPFTEGLQILAYNGQPNITSIGDHSMP